MNQDSEQAANNANDVGTVKNIGINSQPAPTPSRSGRQAWALYIEGMNGSVGFTSPLIPIFIDSVSASKS